MIEEMTFGKALKWLYGPDKLSVDDLFDMYEYLQRRARDPDSLIEFVEVGSN